MKRTTLLLLPVLMVGAFTAVPVTAEEPKRPATEIEKESYTLGADLIKRCREQGIEVDLDMLVLGMRDSLGGGKLLLSEKEMKAIIAKLRTEYRQKERTQLREQQKELTKPVP
jgi:FKBP-type peptidyl-prolyl cis-trans isomerase FklB